MISAAISYHLLAIIAQLLPATGLAQRVRTTIRGPARAAQYVRATWNIQTWRMFSPNPHRDNVHVRVFVVDADGERWNLRHDVRTRRRFPYLFYDRMGKLNRRLSQDTQFHPIYAAWVCRDWELQRLRGLHQNPAAARVELVRVSNWIPPPARAIETGGYHPRQLRLRHKPLADYACAELPHGQVPNVLRARHHVPLRTETRGPGDLFVDVPVKTWWTRERRRARGEAEPTDAASPDARLTEAAGGEDDL